jgi:putative ABC transport system permease protein
VTTRRLILEQTRQGQTRKRRGGRLYGVWDSTKIAWDSLRSNRLRTMLTMLGVIIGVWSVVSLLAIGEGAQKSITDQVQSIGTNLVTVFPGVRPRNNPRQYSGSAQNLTMDDARIIREAIPGVSYIAPEYQNDSQIVAGSQNRSARVLGVTPEYLIVRNIKLAAGQFITDQMVRAGRPVAVLGGTLSEELYGRTNPVGQTIRVKGRQLLIVGVLQPGGAFGAYDGAVLVPVTTAHQQLFGGRDVTSASYQLTAILVQVTNAADVDVTQIRVEQLLRKRHNLPEDGTGDDFTVVNQATLLQTYSTVTTTLTFFLGAIAGISLLVGGIGVMNIMLVSVTERTREIGLRKAVGAKRSDIMRQFLIESLVMSSLGGIAGLAIGYATVTTLGYLFPQYIVPIVTPLAVLLALSCSLIVGLFFGIYPARRAARLNPIEALRYD